MKYLVEHSECTVQYIKLLSMTAKAKAKTTTTAAAAAAAAVRTKMLGSNHSLHFNYTVDNHHSGFGCLDRTGLQLQHGLD